MNNSYIGVVLSDMHIGVTDTKKFYNNEIKPIIASLYLFRKLDYIIISGDFFHNRISMNSGGIHANKIMSDLVKLAKVKKAKIRILKGTDSHDWNQLENFSIYESDMVDVDFRIIRSLEDEYLFSDMKVLYVPEEYVDNKEEYYGKYFNNYGEYDMVIGHGLVEGALPNVAVTNSFTHNKHAPVFERNDFLCSKGPVIFGHIHTRMILFDRVFYVGSLSRYCMGEEEAKGFMIVASTPATNEYVIKFIENKNARTFTTINIGNLINGMKAEEIIELISNHADKHKIDYLRVKIRLLNTDEATMANLEIVAKYYNRDPHVTIDIEDIHLNKIKKDSDDKVKELVNTFGFLFDKNKTYQDKIKSYFDIKKGEILSENEDLDLDVDFIKDTLNI